MGNGVNRLSPSSSSVATASSQSWEKQLKPNFKVAVSYTVELIKDGTILDVLLSKEVLTTDQYERMRSSCPKKAARSLLLLLEIGTKFDTFLAILPEVEGAKELHSKLTESQASSRSDSDSDPDSESDSDSDHNHNGGERRTILTVSVLKKYKRVYKRHRHSFRSTIEKAFSKVYRKRVKLEETYTKKLYRSDSAHSGIAITDTVVFRIVFPSLRNPQEFKPHRECIVRELAGVMNIPEDQIEVFASNGSCILSITVPGNGFICFVAALDAPSNLDFLRTVDDKVIVNIDELFEIFLSEMLHDTEGEDKAYKDARKRTMKTITAVPLIARKFFSSVKSSNISEPKPDDHDKPLYQFAFEEDRAASELHYKGQTMPAGRDRYFERMMRESKRDQLEAEAKIFHDFLLQSEALPLGRIVSRADLKELFKKFRSNPDLEPGMKFDKYITVIVQFVGGLKRKRFESFEICPWPPSMTHQELVHFYLEEREKFSESTTSGSYKTLINFLLGQSNGKILRKAMGLTKFDVELSFDCSHLGYINFGKVSISGRKEAVIRLMNSSKTHAVKLMNCITTNESGTFALEDELKIGTAEGSVEIEPEEEYSVSLIFSPKSISMHATQIFFELRDSQSGRKFDMYCYARGSVSSSLMDFAPVASPKPRLRRPRGQFETVLGIKPRRPHHALPLGYLGDYKIPKKFQEHIAHGRPTKEFEKLLCKTLGAGNYKEKLQCLLWAEERQMHIDIKKYYREERMELDFGGLFKLEVKGLAENRPSLVRGDHITVIVKESQRKYVGYVHHVELEQVKLKFHCSFQDKEFFAGKRFYITFAFHRVPMRVMHKAVCNSNHLIPTVLFPKAVMKLFQVRSIERFYDKDVESNAEQRKAVENIVSGTSGSAPYIIFGPPGTGKTTTTVEAIKQVLQKGPNIRVLACAPSDSAADLICENVLKHVDVRHVFRMNAEGRSEFRIAKQIMEVSCYDYRTKSFKFPDKQELSHYRVIVTTLVTAGRLVSAKIGETFFSHIFIDEAGYATEPETLIPLSGLLNDSSQLVLAGDPKQLGPILRSAIATTYGLQVSLLERLMTTKSLPYIRKEKSPHYNDRLVTMLINNYRSHPDIITVSNELFYNNELKYRADEGLRSCFCKWKHLPKADFPVVFDDVIGKDTRKPDSPSFYNPAEIIKVVEWVDRLLNDTKGIGVRPEDIGIISPYRKQVQETRIEIRKKLRVRGEIKVGTVEEFQGQERLVIIISTVRSDEQYLADDAYYKLGFVKSPKRFNVAITRAKALLIVVGNPFLLKFDNSWNRFMTHVFERGGFCGNTDFLPSPDFECPESDDHSDVVAQEAGNEDEGSEFSKQIDLPWSSDRI